MKPATKFEILWRSLGGCELKKEYQFAPKRKFRMDYYGETNGKRFCVELEGGIYVRGRHTRPSGFLRDMEKYNLAAQLGIFVFRIPSHNISAEWIVPILKGLK
ncbi:MAG: hypothetical protein EBR82_48165 [Caulobacteraceae bacterium]|nr:hypothetical protein [Caulobacteraceae bacterium]